MSFDVFLQAFACGEGALGDGEAVERLIAPLITERSRTSARVVTADGGADVHGLDDPSSGVMFNHVDGLTAWDLIVGVARAAGLAVLPVGCPTCVVSHDVLGDLPPQLVADAIVVRSGEDLLAAVLNA